MNLGKYLVDRNKFFVNEVWVVCPICPISRAHPPQVAAGANLYSSSLLLASAISRSCSRVSNPLSGIFKPAKNNSQVSVI